LDPASINLEWDARTQTKRFVRDSQEGRRIFTTEEVIHIPAFTLDGIYGCSRISYCRQTLGTALARAEFEGTFYRQGARIPGVIEYPGKLTEQATKNLSEGFSRWHSGSANMHKVPVLEDGASFKGVSMPLQDMEFVSSQQLSLTEIAVMFNLPPAYLGGSTGDSLDLRDDRVEPDPVRADGDQPLDELDRQVD
jgi:HK97 family phage portal protein